MVKKALAGIPWGSEYSFGLRTFMVVNAAAWSQCRQADCWMFVAVCYVPPVIFIED